MVRTPNGEKIQKILARRGVGSRRAMEKAIVEGRIHVNGQQASLGDRALEQDKIEVDGQLVEEHFAPVRVILYNKPEGQVCTRKDEKGRVTVFADLPKLIKQRWINIGRLDINTSGLLLFTTDGELANKLMHPSSNIDREYMVRVFGDVTEENISAMLNGVELEDGLARFSDIVEGDNDKGLNKWYTVCLMEGRNREVRRLWESQDLKVNRLKRVRYGPIFLPSYVRSGQWNDLSSSEIKTLYKSCGLSEPRLLGPMANDKDRHARHERKLRSRGRR